MDLEIDGNVALCTAASSGLGLASATALARNGADIALCGQTESHLESAKTAVAAAGDGDVRAVQVDITNRDHIEAFVEGTADEFGGIDHVVTSAGGVPPGSFDDISEQEWYDAYDMLVMSVVWTLKATRQELAESDAGTAVAITSLSVLEALDDLLLSNAVRRGVIGLVETVSREFAPEVRVNAVCPGSHETPRIEQLINDAVERGDVESYEEGYQEWADGVPLDRIGDPRELGDVVAFLSSRRASYVNGVALPVDGGSLRD
jgi:NAD(P)-dependent dehydrogenase (short-subunit alcohol dehydrogenase family)